MNFSERQGLAADFQRGRMDDRLRAAIWNAYDEFRAKLANRTAVFIHDPSSAYEGMFEWIWTRFLSEPRDILHTHVMPTLNAWDHLRSWFFEAEWNEVYDFVEFVTSGVSEEFADLCNAALVRERAAYRLVNGRVIELTDEGQLKALKEALLSSEPFRPVHEHLRTALVRLSDRPEPDTRNAMDEAISAVEALVRVIAEDPGATLDTGLKRIESRKLLPSLHPSLIKAWGNIYGYTSDTVRHASKDARPKQEEARYLLVTCAAFVSYLIALDDGRSIHVGRSHGP